jgi:glycerol-3-phosphate dehydrogenase (NAD(P)+)
MASDEKRIGVIGAGAFGTSLAKVMAEKGTGVTLWCFSPVTRDDINNLHENREFLPGVNLPENIKAVCELEDSVAGKDALILALPSIFLIETIKKILSVPDIREGQTLISTVTKGFLPGKDMPKFIVESLENYLPGFYKGNVVYVSGPSHAEEVGRGKITGLISASANPRNAIFFRDLLASPSIKIFPSLDVIGVQTCAAVKNVIAIAFGIIDALKEQSDWVGDNTESLIFAAGLNEIQTIGKALGSTHPETFTSIAGVGDLDVTCRSVFGRNRRFGREIILKKIIDPYRDIDDIIGNIGAFGYLPEGVMAAKYSVQIADRHKLKLPIIRSLYRILNREADAIEVVKDFLGF